MSEKERRDWDLNSKGEEYLNTKKNYFEGWYFKNTNNERW